MEAHLATENNFTSGILKKKTKKHQLYHKQVFLDSSLPAQESHSEFTRCALQRGSFSYYKIQTNAYWQVFTVSTPETIRIIVYL